MDLNMLNLAMKRIKLPELFRKLILNLFTNRTNQLLTCHGPTNSYKVLVGVDQGEIISPLLWVIYLNSLIIELNRSASSHYRLNSSILDSVYPRQFTTRELNFSQLTFMDDSTLIASSKAGLTTLLSITEEFYGLNNTAANHSKYVLISTDMKQPQDISFNLIPSPLHTTNSITIRSNDPIQSFRFLGVWFNLSISTKFVKTQLTREYNQFTNVLRFKKLTGKQLVYLHNNVLIPKLEYRSQVTSLSQAECSLISRPFKSLFKRKLGLCRVFPNVGLHSPQFYNLINLYNHLTQHHISTLYRLLNFSNLIKDIFLIRLDNLRDKMWLPYSPLNVTNWKPWIDNKSIKTDFLPMTLYHASVLNYHYDI